MRDYDEELELERYLWRNYGNLFSALDHRVSSTVAALKIAETVQSNESRAAYLRLVRRRAGAEVLAALEGGGNQYLGY